MSWDDLQTTPSPEQPVELYAISFARDSDQKEERLREWRERKGISYVEREHRRNGWTANRYGAKITGELSSFECASDVGQRGDQIIAMARETGANAVIIPSLRRLGVGVAQIQLRRMIEETGLVIISENRRERDILLCEPSARREKDLCVIATDDEYEWLKNKERLARARAKIRGTAEWDETLDFVADRPHLNYQQLAEILQARGRRTVTGNTIWTRMQVSRARQEATQRNRRTVTRRRSKRLEAVS